MRLGGRQVAGPEMGSSKRSLDARQQFGIGERRRRLVRPRGRGVVADPRAQVTDPRVELGRSGMAEGQGGLVGVDCLAICVDPGRGLAGIPEGRRCLGVAAGLPLVASDARKPRGVIAGGAHGIEPDGLGDPPMEQPAPGQARRLLGQVAQRAMGEVVGRHPFRLAGLPDEPARRKLVQCVEDFVVGPAARVAEGWDLEGAPDRRRGGEHLRRDAIDTGQTLGQDRAHPARQCAARVPGRVGRRRHRRRQVQRQTL